MGGPYSTYSEYDRARKTLRSGERSSFVTDALSNRFREEYMLNLKADYAFVMKNGGLWAVYKI
jgi:hypothetical protein